MGVIKIKKGLDINLKGKARPTVSDLPMSGTYAVRAEEFRELKPKILKKPGEKVKAGTILFYDKENEALRVPSPVSGEVLEIKRGERRKVIEVVIKPDETVEYEQFDVKNYENLSREDIIKLLIDSGLWIGIIQRPWGIVAMPEKTPKNIHISTFDSAPLAPDYQFIFKDDFEDFQIGVNVLKKLTDGEVFLNLKAGINDNIFEKTEGVKKNYFSGPHPAGNVGIQIAHTTPVNKGETIWTAKVQSVVYIGRFFRTGKVDLRKTIALAGSEVKEPQYYRLISGARMEDIVKGKIAEGNVRIISGNVLTGYKAGLKDHLGFYHNIVSVIPEGNYYEMFGWMKPGFNKFSISRTFFSWLQPKKEWVIDTNLHGGERPFVFTGIIDKVLPMDIYPTQLLKSIIFEDLELMEKLGIYEVVEEDFALCEFVCVSKINIQELIGKGISLMIKEVGR